MMRVISVYKIKGRGTVAEVVTDGPCPVVGSHVRRVSDGMARKILGVQRFALYLGSVGKTGENVGLVLGDAEVAEGDELETVK